MKTIYFIVLSLICSRCFTVTAQGKLFPIEIKGKWGYMDSLGKMHIPAQFDYADDFNEGFAVVALNRMPCIIDLQAKRVVDTGLYQNISRVSEGLAAVTDYQWKRYYVNTRGAVVISLPSEVYEARPFYNGVAVVSIATDIHETKFGRDIATFGYLFGYIDKTGKMLTGFIYDDADDMQNGLSRMKKGLKFGLVNTIGEEVIKPKYNNIGIFTEGLAAVDAGGFYGVINEKAEEVIKPKFEFIYPFSQGLAGFWQKGKYGFIDASGEIMVQPVFDAIKPFAEGKAAAKKDGKWGFIDTKGNWVIRNVFDEAGMFADGFCAVLFKRKWGYINASGQTVIPYDFDAAGAFHDGVANVLYKDISLYIDKLGRILPILK